MHWRYHPKELPLAFQEGYLLPEGYYPSEGIMDSTPGRRVTELDVGAVVAAAGQPIGEFNGHEILAGTRSVSRESEDWIRDDLLVDRLSIYDAPAIRQHLERQYNALVLAGYNPRNEYVGLLSRLVKAFRSETEEERLTGVMEVFKLLTEIDR